MRPRSLVAVALFTVAGCAAAIPPTAAPPKVRAPSVQPDVAPPSFAVTGPSSSTGASGRATAVGDLLTYRGGPDRTGQMPGPGPDGTPSIRWTFKAGAPIGSQVAVEGRLVYLISTDGTLHAVDLDTGKQRWSAPIGSKVQGSPTIVDGLVVVGASDGAHAVSTGDGRVVWTQPKAGAVGGTPAIVGHTAVFASSDLGVTALDTGTGAVLWHHSVTSQNDTSVATADGVAVVGFRDGFVLALSLADGSERWRVDTGDGARVGTPTIADGRAYVVTLDGGGAGSRHLAALDLATGRVLWRIASPGDRPTYSPAVADGRAITEGEDGHITALDPVTGTVLWQANAPGLVEVVPAVADGIVYGASNGGFVFAVDAATGKEIWKLPILGVPYGAAVTSGLVLVGTDVGTLYAIGGSGS